MNLVTLSELYLADRLGLSASHRADVLSVARRAKIEPGQVDGIPAALWWPAIILTTYWSGARVGSLLAVAPNDWDSATATLIVTKTKTGKAAAYRLHKQAADAVNRILRPNRPDAERLFPWPHCRSHLYHTFRRLANEAGVPCIQGKNFGLFHKLRRTMLSYCWAVDPAIAQRQADHSSPATTKRHYVDPRIIADTARSAADVLPVPDI